MLGADNQWAVPLAALVGMPIYLDGYAALPFVRGLIDSGMGQGAPECFTVWLDFWLVPNGGDQWRCMRFN